MVTSIGAKGFFPDRVFSDREKLNDFIVGWYSTHLKTMDEPSLWEASTDATLHAYRFLWLRTFHEPLAVRITLDKAATGEITVKVLDGKGGYAPGKLVKNQTSVLTKEQIDSMLNQIQRSSFWHLPSSSDTLVAPPPDAARWVLEGVKNGKYHVVDRFSPEPGPFRDTALLFLNLSGQPLTPIY